MELLESEPEHIERLWVNTRHFQEGVDALGFETGKQQSPIVPIRVGDEQLTLSVCNRLFEEGVFTSPILYPAVPAGMAMIRTSCMATHTAEHMERALDAFERVGREAGLI